MIDLAGWRNWIIYTPPQDFWFWALALLVGGALTGIGIFYFVRRARLIEDTPTSKVRSAVQGYLELHGKGRNMEGEPLVAPLTGTPCTWYSYKIERKVMAGKGSRWRTVKSETSSNPFLLVDETGHCIVNPHGAEVVPATRQVWHGDSTAAQRAGIQTTGWLARLAGSGRYRYTEKRMHEGESLYALGEFLSLNEDDSRGSIERETIATLKRWKQKPQALLRHFDHDGNGEIDLGEWERVREAARKNVLYKRVNKPVQDAVHTLGRSGHGRPFILSVESQRSLSRKFRIKAAACLAAFVVSGPVSLWMILLRVTSQAF